MKTVLLGAVVVITATLAHAEDMAEMISQYRHAHGLSAVKTDPQLTAIAERQAKAMAASGIMDHTWPDHSPHGSPARVRTWRPRT